MRKEARLPLLTYYHSDGFGGVGPALLNSDGSSRFLNNTRWMPSHPKHKIYKK